MLYKLFYFQCFLKIMMILNQCMFELISFEFSFGCPERDMSSECRITIKNFGETHCKKLQRLCIRFWKDVEGVESFPYESFLRLDSSNHN